MKRKRKRFVEELERLLQEVKPGNYFFPYQRDTINFWWWNKKEPRIDINCENGQGYIIVDLSKTPLPILKVLVKELTKREKIKNKVDQRI
jgi:hypothetical protein